MSVEHVMERFGRLAAVDQMLEVTVRGLKAYAVEGKVVIPAIERFEWLGPDAETMLDGVLIHECSHASFTNFELLEKEKAANPRWDAAYHRLWNLIEDGWIERDKGAQFAGCAASLEDVHRWMWERGLDGDYGIKDVVATGCGPDGEPAQPFTIFTALLQATLAPFGGVTLDELEAMSPYAPMLAPYLAEIAEARACASTEEAVEIANRIYDTIEQSEREGDGGKAGPLDGDAGSGEGDPGECDPGECDEAGKDGKGGEDKDKAPHSGKMDLERYTPEPSIPINPSEALEVHVDKIFTQPSTTPPYIIFSREFDLVRDFSNDQHAPAGLWDKARDESRSAAEVLTNAFEVALKASANTRAVGGYDVGEPDPGLLAEFAVGSCPADQLFMQYERGTGDGTVVAVLGDCSGSMAGSPSMLVRQTMIAINDALAPCQIPVEFTGFTTATDRGGVGDWGSDPSFQRMMREHFAALREALREAEDRGTDLTRFARALFYDSHWSGTLQLPVYAIFKKFDQHDARGLLNVDGLNHNLDGEAVMWQARRLAARPERRRVMFVLSDGLPAGSRDNAAGAAYLKDSIEHVIAAGIEVYGIGMRSKHVRKFYPRAWVCNDLEDLTDLALGALTDVLLQGYQEHEWVDVA